MLRAMESGAVTFDTLAYTRRLEAAGVDRAQAEAHADAVRDAVAESSATKTDLSAMEARMTARLYGAIAVVCGLVAAGAGVAIGVLAWLLP